MKYFILSIVLFPIMNIFGQTYDDIQRKIDSLQAEKNKIISITHPKKIEKLQKENDSLNYQKEKFSTLIIEINQKIALNNQNISSLKKGIPVQNFQETIIITREALPFKTLPDLTGKIEYWIPVNTNLAIIDYVNDEWAKVKHNENIGYILASRLEYYSNVENQIVKIKQQKKFLKEEDEKSVNKSNETFYLNSISTNSQRTPTNYNNSRTYYTGSRGGCYYINSGGNKQYVDRSLCK